MKSGLGRISESTAKYQGVVVYNMADVPLVIQKLIVIKRINELIF